MTKNELIFLDIHSAVDVITNSSTVIYTYEWGCEEPVKRLIDEVLRLQGSDKKWSDVFCIGVFCSENDYVGRIHDWEELEDAPVDRSERKDWVKSKIISVLKGEIDRPKWMTDAEKDDDAGEGCAPNSRLAILVKDVEYEKLAKHVKDVIFGVHADSRYEG